MVNLAVCADGTWNTPDDKEGGLPSPTNVVKLYNAVREDDAAIPQKRYYHPGVGTDGSWWDRLRGGGTGRGLDRNIMSAYRWLAVHYRPGDRIFLFGFSRGAYTVRSLGGMIARCGLLDLSQHDPADPGVWTGIQRVFDCYRTRSGDLDGLRFHNAAGGAPASATTPIHFIGVWDTVGALGIPDDLALLNLIDDPAEHAFHDTELSDCVVHARHAVAMDEMRQSFTPTLWTNVGDRLEADPDPADPGRRTIRQIWFPGVHGDVGGGYSQKGLADGSLLWMMEEAHKAGLAFRDGVLGQLRPDAQDVLHDSCTGVFSALKTEPRQVPHIKENRGLFHPSASLRHGNPPLHEPYYWRTRQLDKGESVSLDIFAQQRWNVTGLFLVAGETYRFSARGQWLDASVSCGPGGTDDGRFQLAEAAHLAASTFGRIEGLFQLVSRNPKADFWWTKRLEEAPWFALIGTVANAAVPENRWTGPNEVFAIGDGVDFTPRSSGYFYCFANDAWHAYDNNRGSVTLEVTHLQPG